MELNWKGCGIKIQDAKKTSDGYYYSDRNDSDIYLISKQFEVIQVEDWNKWYGLYYLTHDEHMKEKLVTIQFSSGIDSILDGIDHTFYPNSVVEFAKVNGLKIDVISYIAICKMYIEDLCSADDGYTIPNEHLPKAADLMDVIALDSVGNCTSFNLYYDYDRVTAPMYIQNNRASK